MGDPSDLRFMPASMANIPIDWSRIPEASKKKMLEWAFDWDNEVTRPLPPTIADLAKMLDGKKFFGYFRPSVCTLIMDISEFGLQAAPVDVMGAGPRFYMKYTAQVWFLLFTPGKRECISGYSHDIPFKDEEDEQAAEDAVLAQEFDVRLEREVSRGLVGVTKDLGGWYASTLEDDLEVAQLTEAIMTLPRSHPAYKALYANMFNYR
jgi:hypothetical protein